MTAHATPERLGAFSDGVIAVIITIMVLELKPPEGAHLYDLLTLWPRFLSYGMSYLFVGIVWINHHHMLRYTEHAGPDLLWSNLLFLFTVSLIPFATYWLETAGITAVPVAFYALVFCMVNISYILFSRSILSGCSGEGKPALTRLRQRSAARANLTLLVYGCAGALALWHAGAGFALLFANTLVYALPERFAARAAQPRAGFAAPNAQNVDKQNVGEPES